ncbi:MAG: hypothetical protein ACKPKO_49515 [Candidatus Fonsibacter sp.]
MIANYYTNSHVNNLLNGKQNTITSSTDLTINKLICNNFEPTTVNTDMIIKANNVCVIVSPNNTLLAFIIISLLIVVGSKLLQINLFIVKLVDEVIIFCFPLNRLSTCEFVKKSYQPVYI